MARNYDVSHWRKLAQDARAAADAMTAPEAKRQLLAIAEDYERLADHAERTAGRKAPLSRN